MCALPTQRPQCSAPDVQDVPMIRRTLIVVSLALVLLGLWLFLLIGSGCEGSCNSHYLVPAGCLLASFVAALVANRL